MMSTTQVMKTGIAVIAAVALVWLSVSANLRQSCVIDDAPYLALCGERPAPGSAERLMELRHRIAANPGDSQAYVGLSYFPQDTRRPAMVRAASALAPNDLNVLMARAALAIEENRLADAARELVHLTEHYHHLTQAPAKALVQMILENHSALLQNHLTPGSHWFPLVLATMVEQRASLAAASPLLPRAVESGALPAHRVGEFIDMLKREGNWVDAYGLWLAQHGGRAPMLYNASFDQPFQAAGFDWEVTPERIGREGAGVAARPLGGHGRILEISFTGRSMPTPIVRAARFPGAGALSAYRPIHGVEAAHRGWLGVGGAVWCRRQTTARRQEYGFAGFAGAVARLRLRHRRAGQVRPGSQPATRGICAL